jgi:AbrB family looped-hinge helix DNA binding protein
MPTATLSSKGQTVIPKSIRDQLGLRPGDTIDFIMQENGDILIRPAAQNIQKLKGMLYRPDRRPVSIEDMNIAIQHRKRNV